MRAMRALRHRSRRAQLKLMLRQQEDLDVVLLLVAWYVWRERVAWLQTSLWWKRTSGRVGFLQEALQHWRSAVPLTRQEAIDEQLTALQGSMVQDEAIHQVAEKIEEHGSKVLHHLQEQLQKKDAQTLRWKIFHSWQRAASKHQTFGTFGPFARRARLVHALTRPHHVRMARQAFGSWRQEALENRESKGAARLFLKFKLLHQGSWQKEQLHVMLLRWFSLVQRPRPWDRAWQLRTELHLRISEVTSSQLLAQCMNAWRETLRRTVDEAKEETAVRLPQERLSQAEPMVPTLAERESQQGSNGAEELRDVLRGERATVVSSSMQKKMQHSRKLQVHAEITKLCVRTGDWIDQLWLREVLAVWQRQALQEILTRHAAEEERSRNLQVRLKKHYRIIEIIRGKSTERLVALALAHVCLGAWSISAAMENAKKLTDKARQNSEGHRLHGRRMLSDAQDLAGDVLAFCFRRSLSAGAGWQKSAWPLVKRCFPLWKREAALSLARRQILAQQAANLRVTEGMRLQTERYQERCSRWAVVQMIQHQNMRYLEEAFFLWWSGEKPKWRHGPWHRKQLELADVVLMRGAKELQVVFVAWKRIQVEEKVMRSEDEMWQLEARLARLAGERGLSMRALEERLSLEGTF